MPSHMQLFRPVGLNELVLVFRERMRGFPPRLPEQPIFYPVVNSEYAHEIARKWNTKSGTFAGYVTEFDVDDEHVARYEVRQVGTRVHRELWVPAESLAEFNAHIFGQIRLRAAYFGPEFAGLIPSRFGLRGKNAREQWSALAVTHDYSLMDFVCEIGANAEAVFVNFPYWQQLARDDAPSRPGSEALLEEIRRVWKSHAPWLPLGTQ